MLIMGKLRNLYTKYATIGDLLHNDIVMPNESFHLLLEDLHTTAHWYPNWTPRDMGTSRTVKLKYCIK